MITTLTEFQALPFFRTIVVDNLHVSAEEWLLLLDTFKADQRQRLTLTYFLNELARIRNVSYPILASALEKEQPQRGVKRPRSERGDLFDLDRRRFYHEPEPGSYLVRDTEGKAFENESHPGIKQVPIVDGQTPGGTRVRPLFTRNGKTVHVPETPLSKRVPIQPPSPTFFSRHRSRRPGPLSFVVDWGMLSERQGLERPRSQNAVMGVSAREVFNRHGVEANGNLDTQFHWAHLWAHFLGGPAAYMVASTALSNYFALALIEKYIFSLLHDQKTSQVCVQVIPEYSEGKLIPDMLVYQLNWQETDASGQVRQQSEEFRINPCSTRRFSAEQVEAIGSLRNGPG